MTLRGYALVAAAATGWGCWALFLGPARLSGAQGALVLFAVMSVPCLGLLFTRPKLDRVAWLALGVLGIADAGNAALYFGAISPRPALGRGAHPLSGSAPRRAGGAARAP